MATAIPGTGLPPTAQLKKDQRKAMDAGRALTQQTNNSNIVLQTQSAVVMPDYVIYVYNICELEHTIEQPPAFPHFHIPKCEPGKKFSVTLLPALVKERYEKPGETEYHYKLEDGRKYATSLLNPDSYPGTDFAAQLIEGRTGNDDMTGMNRNAFGVFWSLTHPDDPALDKEIKLFRKRLDKTMDELVTRGNQLNAAGKLGEITPLMHFAMEYFHLTASWHMSHQHKTPCPNCGDPILEGLAYHYNQHGDRCIIDRERYLASVVEAPKEQQEAPTAKRGRRAPSAT